FSHNTRLDMLDYFNYGKDTPSRNILGGSSRITANNPSLLSVKVSDIASMDLAVIPLKRDTVLAVIETVATPVPDSHITLYDSSWQALNVQPPRLTTTDFVSASDRRKAAGTELPPFPFYTITFRPEDGAFRFVNTTGGYYDKADSPDGLSLMKSELWMKFDGKKWKQL
ncbi:MAG: DUF3256 family protein, partial [Muribaculaceae bacterium]|nr:DUF3256 family protein [Muribaculaceae bacterium]